MRSWGAEGLTGAAPSMPPPTDGPDSDDVIPLTDGALKPPWGFGEDPTDPEDLFIPIPGILRACPDDGLTG